MTRPSWGEYFMSQARLAATRSTCDRAHVGAVLVHDNRVIATGYNGAPSAYPECDEVGHLMVNGHCERSIHAEVNAVIQCAIVGVPCRGATLYVTHTPCHRCQLILDQAGITDIHIDTPYREGEL